MNDSMGVPLEPKEAKIIGHDYQGDEIYEFDTYYVMPNGDMIIEGCEKEYINDVANKVHGDFGEEVRFGTE